jgi:cell division protein FtsB
MMKINKQKFIENLKLLSDVRIIGLLAFFAVILLVAFSSVKILQTNYELQKKENELKQVNEIKKLENENLKLKNVFFESDEYLELTARRQFNKALPGEELYIIPESVAMRKVKDTPKVSTEQEEIRQKEEKKPKYQRNIEAWRDFLLHKTDN